MDTILHVAPGSQGIHHWVYQILATLLIFGLWIYLAGLADRRRTGRAERQPSPAANRDVPEPEDGSPDGEEDLVVKTESSPSEPGKPTGSGENTPKLHARPP